MAQAKKPSKAAEPEVTGYDSIEAELIDATDLKAQGKKEDRQAFLARAVSALDEMETDDYEKLSSELQEWFAAAVEAHNADQELPDFPDVAEDEPGEEAGEEDAGEEPATEEDDQDQEEDVTTKKATPKKAPAKKAAAPAKKAAAPAKKAAAPAKKAAAGNGYKGHREGSKAEKAHEMVDNMVKAKKDRAVIIKALEEKIGLTKATAAGWYRQFSA